MRFYDEVLRAAHIDQKAKDMIANCVVIDASNVAQYYFEGADKEYRTFMDVPNIAPPFGSFWLDFDAPKYHACPRPTRTNGAVRGPLDGEFTVRQRLARGMLIVSNQKRGAMR